MALNVMPIEPGRVFVWVRGPNALSWVAVTMACIIQKDETASSSSLSEPQNLCCQFVLGIFAWYVPDFDREVEPVSEKVSQLFNFNDDIKIVISPSQKQDGDVIVFGFWPFAILSFEILVQPSLLVNVVVKVTGRRGVLGIDG